MNLKTFKTLQYNITYILHINSSNRMFCSIHDFTFVMTNTKICFGQICFESSEIKKLLHAQFLVKFVMLPVWSIAQGNWFSCLHKCNCVGLIDKLEVFWFLWNFFRTAFLWNISGCLLYCYYLNYQFFEFFFF